MAKLSVYHNGKLIRELHLQPGEEYTVGRDVTADIQLGASKGISRQHLRISYQDGNWYLQVLSQFGNVLYEGESVDELLLDSKCQFKLPPYDFHFTNEVSISKELQVMSDELPPLPDEVESSVKQDSEPEIDRNPFAVSTTTDTNTDKSESKKLPVANSHNYKAPQEIALESFSDEDTSPGATQNLVGIIKWRELNGKKKGYKFSAGSCVVGRGDKCDVTVKHNKLSRRHFEITKQNNNFTIIDLGSANGTMINGKVVSTHQPLRIESGDEISVSNFKFSFEIKDEQFAQKLNNVPVLQTPPSHHLPLPPQAAGARVVKVGRNQQRHVLRDPKEKNKYIKYAIFALVPVLIVGLLLNDKKPVPSGTVSTSSEVLTFDKLTPEEKQAVRDSFKLGKNHFNQKKYANCVSEFKKIHNIIPFYENSKELLGLCEQALDMEGEMLAQEEKERKQRELELRIETIVNDCKLRINNFKNMAEANSCIADAMTMFPDHPAILDFQQAIIIREQQERDQAAARIKRQNLINAGESLYKSASREYKGENFRKAIDLFNQYLSAQYPDPNGNRSTAQRDLASAKSKLTQKVNSLFDECKKLHSDHKYKEAIIACDKAKAEDPKNEEVVGFRNSVLSELRKEMKLIYQDAILEENLGNVDAAKEKWKKIMELDLPSDEFYKKSKSKLKKYGIGI
ncbi:MAG: FHA domain-containing protein [Bdellovibrionales bacterium]|nr:FHA domain-containing protein [Bdellovibrionales bacterium]